jgi:secreted trypsin-like serine protease
MHIGKRFKGEVGLGARSYRKAVKTGSLRARLLLALVLVVGTCLGAAVPVFAIEGEPEVQPNIVGGTTVPTGKYKFIAAVRNLDNGGSVYQQQYCAGTLIDRNSVLTAAHCLETVTAGRLRVTVGITALNERQGQTRSVKSIFRHPKYSSVNRRYDAAVLKLSSRIRNIEPIRIPTTASNAFETPGREPTIAGWGNTVKQNPDLSQPDRYPAQMQEARVPIVSDATGRRVYDSSYSPPLMLAAGREGKDTCQGDSGGPLFAQTSSGPRQIGITSFGAGCGARGFPGVYAETNSDEIRGFIYRTARR